MMCEVNFEDTKVHSNLSMFLIKEFFIHFLMELFVCLTVNFGRRIGKCKQCHNYVFVNGNIGCCWYNTINHVRVITMQFSDRIISGINDCLRVHTFFK